MIVRELSLQNFRNIADCTLTLGEHSNVLFGSNAQGKTNLLEGIYLFSTGKSFRAGRERDLIRFGCDAATLTLRFQFQAREQQAQIRLFREGRKKEVTLNDVKLKTSEMLGSFSSVLFAPEHLNLVKEGPGERRRFLDFALSQLKPRYYAVLSAYQKTVAQKNALLKDMARFPQLGDTLGVWNEKLAANGAFLVMNRYQYLNRINTLAAGIHRDLSEGREELSLRYLGFHEGLDDSGYRNLGAITQAFRRALEERESEEIRAGVSLVGPHRDDFDILIGGESCRIFGSQGQQRSAVLSMKIAECEAARAVFGEYPVLLLDDILSELDPQRQSYILHHISGKQVVITTCDRDRFAGLAQQNLFEVENGTIRRQQGL